MTGWRCAAIVGNAEAIARYWRLKTNIDSGLFEAVQLAGVGGAAPARRTTSREMSALYQRRRDLVLRRARARSASDRAPARDDLHLGAGARGPDARPSFAEQVLERAGVVISPGAAYGPTARASSGSR